MIIIGTDSERASMYNTVFKDLVTCKRCGSMSRIKNVTLKDEIEWGQNLTYFFEILDKNIKVEECFHC